MEIKQKLEKLESIGLIYGFFEQDSKIIIEGKTYPAIVECVFDGKKLENNTHYRDPEGFSDIEKYLLGKIDFENSEVFQHYSSCSEYRRKENEKKEAEKEKNRWAEKIINNGIVISKKDNTSGNVVKMWKETEEKQTCIGKTLDWRKIAKDEKGAYILSETKVEYEGKKYTIFGKKHGPFNAYFQEVYEGDQYRGCVS